MESPFFSALLDFSVVLSANLKGAGKKRTLQKHPFGQPFNRMTPSLLLWRAPSKEEYGYPDGFGELPMSRSQPSWLGVSYTKADLSGVREK